jgi:preprotein translocase subunit YajC
MEGMSTIMMLVIMVAIFYFMLIRPENKRKKKAQELRDSLKKGDVITTIGGIVGKIVTVKQDTIVIETSDDRVRMELTKWAVSTTGVQSGETVQAENKKKGKEKAEEKAEELPEEPVNEIPEPEESEKQEESNS